VKTQHWVATAIGVGLVIYFFESRPTPAPKKTVPTAFVDSIRYVKRKNGTEARIISLIGDVPCIRGELSDGSSVQVMHSYNLRRVGRDALLFDERGSTVGSVQINYEGITCPGDLDNKDTETSGEDGSDQ